MGGFVLLKGMVAEMETGEGKTLTATLAASAAALAGIPVHVICVNDYLTARDAEAMGPVYEALGLSVGCVIHGKTPKERQAAYRLSHHLLQQQGDSLRLPARQADARRDDGYASPAGRIPLLGQRCGRTAFFCGDSISRICDEADSLLVDESRTPLIISGAGGGKEEETFLRQAMSLATNAQ